MPNFVPAKNIGDDIYIQSRLVEMKLGVTCRFSSDLSDFPSGDVKEVLSKGKICWYNSSDNSIVFYIPNTVADRVVSSAVYEMLYQKGIDGILPQSLHNDFYTSLGRLSGIKTPGLRDSYYNQGRDYLSSLIVSSSRASDWKPVSDTLSAILGLHVPDYFPGSVREALREHERYVFKARNKEKDYKYLADSFISKYRNGVDGDFKKYPLVSAGDCYSVAGYNQSVLSCSMFALKKFSDKSGVSLDNQIIADIIENVSEPLGIFRLKSRNKEVNPHCFIVTGLYSEGKGYLTVSMDDAVAAKGNSLVLSNFEFSSVERVCKLFNTVDRKYGNVLFMEERRGDRAGFRLVDDLFRKFGLDYYQFSSKKVKPRLSPEASVLLPVDRVASGYRNHVSLEQNISRLGELVEKYGIELSPEYVPVKSSSAVETAGDETTVRNRTMDERMNASVTPVRVGDKACKKLQKNDIFSASDILHRGYEGVKEILTLREFKQVVSFMSSLSLPFTPQPSRKALSEDRDFNDAMKGLSSTALAECCVFIGRQFARLPDNLGGIDIPFPVDVHGKPFTGMSLVSMAASSICSGPRWDGCNVFVSRKDMISLGLLPNAGAEELYCRRDGDTQYKYYNLADTDYALKFPEEYKSMRELSSSVVCEQYVNNILSNTKKTDIKGIVTMFKQSGMLRGLYENVSSDRNRVDSIATAFPSLFASAVSHINCNQKKN